eukprot:scaffold2143_cov125-Cylindrotheca_fusiformis.AAC.8
MTNTTSNPIQLVAIIIGYGTPGMRGNCEDLNVSHGDTTEGKPEQNLPDSGFLFRPRQESSHIIHTFIVQTHNSKHHEDNPLPWTLARTQLGSRCVVASTTASVYDDIDVLSRTKNDFGFRVDARGRISRCPARRSSSRTCPKVLGSRGSIGKGSKGSRFLFARCCPVTGVSGHATVQSQSKG